MQNGISKGDLKDFGLLELGGIHVVIHAQIDCDIILQTVKDTDASFQGEFFGGNIQKLQTAGTVGKFSGNGVSKDKSNIIVAFLKRLTAVFHLQCKNLKFTEQVALCEDNVVLNVLEHAEEVTIKFLFFLGGKHTFPDFFHAQTPLNIIHQHKLDKAGDSAIQIQIVLNGVFLKILEIIKIPVFLGGRSLKGRFFANCALSVHVGAAVLNDTHGTLAGQNALEQMGILCVGQPFIEADILQTLRTDESCTDLKLADVPFGIQVDDPTSFFELIV